MGEYLLYVRYAISGLAVYEVKTDDIFHIIGKAHYYSPERINWFQFVEDTPSRREFWAQQGRAIERAPHKWHKGGKCDE